MLIEIAPVRLMIPLPPRPDLNKIRFCLIIIDGHILTKNGLVFSPTPPLWQDVQEFSTEVFEDFPPSIYPTNTTSERRAIRVSIKIPHKIPKYQHSDIHSLLGAFSEELVFAES